MNERVVMPIWTFGVFIVVMNTTMFNVSIPGIIQDLNVTAELGSWVVSGYSIGVALSSAIFSRLSDNIPISRLLTFGLIILGVSSIFGLFAHSFYELMAARIMQSAGAGAVFGLGLVLTSRYIPYARRGRAITMISSGSAMAFGMGPIVGGLISEHFGWNALFAVTCFCFLLLVLPMRLLPREKAVTPFQFDGFGAVLTILNTATLLMALTLHSVTWLVISLLSIGIHYWHMKRVKETFLNPSLLKIAAYRKLITIGFCILVLNLGNLFIMPLVLANVFGRSPMAIGFMIAPGAILSACLIRMIGGWIDRYGNMRFLFLGIGSITAVLIFFCLDLATSPTVILCGYLLFAPSVSTVTAALNNEISRILPKQSLGSGMGLMQLITFIGGSFSVAVCGYLLIVQAHIPQITAFRNVYALLLMAALCSLAVLWLYWLTASNCIRDGIDKTVNL